MSLEQLREVRRAGQKPDSVIVIVGRADVDLSPSVVQVTDRSDDLRALIGLPVHVIDVQGDQPLTRHVIEALEALSVRALGICGPAGACGSSKEHERAMTRYRETLCRS